MNANPSSVQAHAHHKPVTLHRTQYFSDTYLLVGYTCSLATCMKSGGTWWADRTVEAAPTSHTDFEHTYRDGRQENVYDGHRGITARGLRMDDFGNLFGKALGNGQVSS